MKNFIIIPTYNERKSIVRLVPKIFELYPDIHVLVADDNSPDGTGNVVREMMNTWKNLSLYARPGKAGLARAYLDSIKKLLSEESDIGFIITMDSDSSHDPIIIRDMQKYISEYDLVIGSRYVPGGKFLNKSYRRQLLSRGGNLYARTIVGSSIRDITAGFNCFRADLLRKYNLNSIHSVGYAFLVEMKVTALRLGARMKEIPIVFLDRDAGESKLSYSDIFEGIIAPWRLRFPQRQK